MQNNTTTNTPAVLLAPTDTGVAAAVLPYVLTAFRFCRDLGAWFYWSGRLWVAEEGPVVQFVLQCVRNLQGEVTDPGHKKCLRDAENHGRLRSVMKILSTFPEIRISASQLDAFKHLLNTPNGVVDLRTGHLLAPAPEMLLTKTTLAGFDPTAEAPLWKHFLERIQPDPEVRAFLKRAVGCTLSGSAREHVVFVAVGEGRNGKNVFIDTLSGLLGDYAGGVPRAILQKSPYERHSTDWMTVRGRRLVFTGELPIDWKLDTAALKALTGGDRITARLVRRDNVTFEPTHQLWIATNYLPVELEASPALAARLVIVPFSVTIPENEQDKNLTQKLLAEGPGIMRWAVDGCLEWQRMGLAIPESVRQRTRVEFEERDAVGLFMRDRLVPMQGSRMTRPILREHLEQWAKQNSIEIKPRHVTDLYRRLVKEGAVEGKTNGVRHFEGVGLAAAVTAPANLRVVNADN